MCKGVGVMWFAFQSEQVSFGATLKNLMRKRGWIKVPPLYYPPEFQNNNDRIVTSKKLNFNFYNPIKRAKRMFTILSKYLFFLYEN